MPCKSLSPGPSDTAKDHLAAYKYMRAAQHPYLDPASLVVRQSTQQPCSSSPSFARCLHPPPRPESLLCTATSTTGGTLTSKPNPTMPTAVRRPRCNSRRNLPVADKILGNLNGKGDTTSSVGGDSGCTTFYRYVDAVMFSTSTHMSLQGA
jgi:hypothetical protein